VTVQFDANSARLTNIAKAKLDEVALKMQEDSDARAMVIGYTDSTGSASANQRMSERRAQAVKDYLVQRHGIDPNRITTEGRGSADPVASNDTAAGRAQNRRAVVIITFQ
jgi:outer membrane protein OmpA-like peptidoglycan-associated protein